jgi:hypothetical protein
VLIAHRFAADFEGEDFAVADDVAERDALGGLNGLDRAASGDAAKQRQAVCRLVCCERGGSTSMERLRLCARLQQALALQVGDVLVHRGQRTEIKTAGDFFIGGGVSVLLGEVRRGSRVLLFDAG